MSGSMIISPCVFISFIELVRSQEDDFSGFQAETYSCSTSGHVCCKENQIVESEATIKCEDDPDYHCVQVIKYTIVFILWIQKLFRCR